MGGACGTYGREVRAGFAYRNLKENSCTLNYVTHKICWVYSSDVRACAFESVDCTHAIFSGTLKTCHSGAVD